MRSNTAGSIGPPCQSPTRQYRSRPKITCFPRPRRKNTSFVYHGAIRKTIGTSNPLKDSSSVINSVQIGQNLAICNKCLDRFLAFRQNGAHCLQRTAMHPADIKAALEKAGYSQTKLADSFNPPRARMTICNVLHGRTTSLEIANKIADLTGIPVSVLWPGKYDRRLARQRLGENANTGCENGEGELPKPGCEGTAQP